MVETDWKEILSFSQKELKEDDKEQLCESLSWMDPDDIELNFVDLKTLFRLAQDILKFKSEQVNNLLGQLDKANKKYKGKGKSSRKTDSPRIKPDLTQEILHQEEIIKSNKEIIERLYNDIAELEGIRKKLEESLERDSESSRSALSELNAVKELENEVSSKNRHIRKLISDIKVTENENLKLKEKASLLKEKLNEATQLIENLTEKLYNVSRENTQLKDVLGKAEETKSTLTLELASIRQELAEKDVMKENLYEDIKTKVQYWKNLARTSKLEIDNLSSENLKLKEALRKTPKSSPKKNVEETLKIQELQEKLSQATNEMVESANIIEKLKEDNQNLKLAIEESAEHSMSDAKNESDDGKERVLISRLKKKVNSLSITNQGLEEMIAEREQQLTEFASQLQLLQTNEGIRQLLESLKVKKKQLKSKDQGIKTLVQEVNSLTQEMDDLHMENETLRQKFNIPSDKNISVKGTLKKFYDLEKEFAKLHKESKINENKIVELELDNLELTSKFTKFTNFLVLQGYDQDQIDLILEQTDVTKSKKQEHKLDFAKYIQQEKELKAVIEENEGLRKSLQELLNFMKDNSNTSSGVLALECPSLDSVLRSMEARSAAGWFAPHMTTVMELRAAIGGRDALLTALHQARKETFDVMQQLSQESSKCKELVQKIQEYESKQDETTTKEAENFSLGEFGTWMLKDEDTNLEINDYTQVDDMLARRNSSYEEQLKSNLIYFHNKYGELFNKMTTMAIQAADDQNKWSVLEEQYKAEAENLKSRIHGFDEEISEDSPGLVTLSSSTTLQRKCSYLEEAYKHFRTMSENFKNEIMELKKEALETAGNHENEIQKLLFIINRLNDKLRNSIPVDICKKLNIDLNEVTFKYRKYLDNTLKTLNDQIAFQKCLEDNKAEITSTVLRMVNSEIAQDQNKVKDLLSEVEVSVLQKQIHQLCQQLENKDKELKISQDKYTELQTEQARMIDATIYSKTEKEVSDMKNQLINLTEENRILKEQFNHTQNHLDVTQIQLQNIEQKQMNNDIEINMLRHQILDLQSTGDNKAIVARLGNEVLIAHLQVTENYNKIERLNAALSKEKQMRVEAEQMLLTREKVFEVYSSRFETKFKYMHEVMQMLRQQYQGCLPIFSIENYLNNYEDYSRKSQSVDSKLSQIEDLQSKLMIKHSVYDHILDVSKNKCLEAEDNCAHRMQIMVLRNTHSREVDHLNKKLQTMERSREEIIQHCNHLEKTIVIINQGFDKLSTDILRGKNELLLNDNNQLDLEDVQSDDDSESRKSKTITLPKPQVLKPVKSKVDVSAHTENEVIINPPVQYTEKTKLLPVVNITTQTSPKKTVADSKLIQTEHDQEINTLKAQILGLVNDNEKKTSDLAEASNRTIQKDQELSVTIREKIELESVIRELKRTLQQKDVAYDNLNSSLEVLKRRLDELQDLQIKEKQKTRHASQEETNSLLLALKQAEQDKDNIIAEYKQLLQNERDEFKKSVRDMQQKIVELQPNLDRGSIDSSATNSFVSSLTNKYSLKIAELEDKCFKLQSQVDISGAEIRSCQSEMERWKNLATDRLLKMEALNSQLEDRHSQEVESYKAENQHWLVQLNESQREHLELRTRLSEQKTAHVRQLQEKDAQIDQLKSLVNGLKTQILSMQTLISTTDPSFDLSAIVEVEETSDHSQSSERLEIKFDSSGDLDDVNDVGKLHASSTTIWQEPIIERLRRDKQLTSKQNSLLRRQIKALAARERRARLDAQNLKNQLFRISTTGKKVPTAETAALHSKIASLQSQLTSARRDTQPAVAIWDKWKRAQEACARWQARFEEKCVEARQLQVSADRAKQAVQRLEREKTVLMTRLARLTDQLEESNRPSLAEKQDGERSEKSHFEHEEKRREQLEQDGAVGARALLQRVEAQQRRIAALEVAEKGNEVLVSEYEKALAEVTSLKGQVLKLESTLLEAQIQTPMHHKDSTQPELEYWKSYCEMLKQENVQLTLRVSTLEGHQHGGATRVNDLEQTVLTLRGLVSKLQSEQKSGYKRVDSRPSSGRSATEKGRTQEWQRTELANLRRSVQDKDALLERCKEMLKIAADREDQLLRENMHLRRRLDELIEAQGATSH